ncbi:MAG: DNA polymerase IV [Lawsonibacter sp.]|nr:DNA polymerase IV [Lawsonibacter sp.]
MDRVIFHCDLNSFYASVELLDHPELRHRPVAVCGDPESRHGIILAKNEPAKAFGIKTAETIWQARKKCRELVLLPAHHSKYHFFSKQINRIYQEYTDLVEPFGIDESWLDVTGTLHLFGGDPVALADQLRSRVRGEFGLTISVGVSFNKVFAKLGSDYKKPDATIEITRENYRKILWPLPVTDLLYVGKAAAQTFEKFNIRTIGDLARFDRESLFLLLGKNGPQLHDFANGLDRAPVAPAAQSTPPKSVGNGLTFPRNLQGQEEIRAGIALLSDQVAVRLRGNGMKCQGVCLSIRDPGFRDLGRQKRLPAPTCLAREITQAAMELAIGCWNMDSPVRALTVTAIHLITADEAGVQLDLLAGGQDQKRERLEKLEGTLDTIRAKYGSGSIFSASAPRNPVEDRHAPPPGSATSYLDE